jgi:hypothetical protein
MDAKLSLYDFLAYILPGAVIAILLYWFSISFLALASFSHVNIPDAVSFLLFLILSYFLGHVVQSIGAKYQKQKEEKDGWLSERYLLDDNSHYTKDYRDSVKASIELHFNLKPDITSSTSNVGDQKRRQQETFYLCNALLRQELPTSNSEIFRTICALYRSLYIVMRIGVWIGGLIFFKQAVWLILLVIHMSLPSYSFFTFDFEQLFLGIVLALFFWWVKSRLRLRWDQYTEYYVDSVYTNFYAWHCLKYKPPPSAHPDEASEANGVSQQQNASV